jgi:hypothetical protein
MKWLARRAKAAAAGLDRRWGRLARPLLRWGVPLFLLTLVTVALTHLGWDKIVSARPQSWLFYLVLALPFFVQPIADLLLYRNLLGVGRALPLTIFLRKRYMNTLMLDYSGEVYLFLWARKHLDVRDGLIMHAVKDSSVLSAAAGLAVLWLMLMVLVGEHIVSIPSLPIGRWPLVLVGSVPLVLGLALFVGNRKLTALSRRQIVSTFAIHLTRATLTLWLEFMIWWLSGALPSSADCLKFVALRLLLTRLPLVPSKDIVWVGVGMAAAGTMAVSAAKVAAVLVMMTAVGLIQDLVLVGLPWLIEQMNLRRRAGSPVA